MSGIVFVHRKGMDFKVRQGLCTDKGHDLLVQAWSLCMERAWFVNSGIVPLHHSILHSYILFTVWVPTNMGVGQALSAPILKLLLVQQIKDKISIFHFYNSFKTIFRFPLFLVMDHLVL